MKKQAFTMAEAILVMTILGIIASIMITTLKPAEFKSKGMAVMADKVLSEIDSATTQILINNSRYNNMATLYAPGGKSSTYAFSANVPYDTSLYRGYLTTKRSGTCSCTGTVMYLKDGSCMSISNSTSSTSTYFPGETGATNVTPAQGSICFDINGNEEPNVLGKDKFVIPIGNDGIAY